MMKICQAQPINTNFDEIFYKSPIGILLYDKKGRLTNANDSALKILRIPKLEDIIETNLFDNHNINSKKEELKEKSLIKFQESLNSGNIGEYSQSNTVNIDWNVSITNSGYLVMIQDVTEQKKAEIALSKSNTNIKRLLNIEILDLEKAEIKSDKQIDDHELAEIKLKKLIAKLEISNIELEQFAYVSSHDLKEPLRMITTFLQLLQKKYENSLDEDAHDYINFAVDGAKRLHIMINDLLEYSRIGSQARELNYINSEEIIEQIILNLKSSIESNNAVLTHDPLPIIYANDQQMVQLFQNLIVNAIKYHGEENPKIHISSEKLDKEYVFAIRDNGIGIEEQHLERIFTIFQRLHNRNDYEGSGMGLSISQKIILEHGGKIWAESELGEGSTFYFTIPFVRE
jgi:chemotaxis family two-component system sensor kinase Cph1